jgi:ribonuclease I
MEPILSQYWPDLQGDNFGLWQKEWQDRASCYGVDPSFYFTYTIGVKVDIDRQIVSNGFGGNSFPGEQVFGALSRQGRYYKATEI